MKKTFYLDLLCTIDGEPQPQVPQLACRKMDNIFSKKYFDEE
jgi:hypothetical protein